MRRLEKADMRQRGRELRALLNEWNPIGIRLGAADDEYDCLLWPLMRLLEQGSTGDAIVTYLTSELRDHFGLSPNERGTAEFAERAKAWFESGWQGTYV